MDILSNTSAIGIEDSLDRKFERLVPLDPFHRSKFPRSGAPKSLCPAPEATESQSAPENGTLEELRNQTIYKDYVAAFSSTTRLPVTLRHGNSWQLPHRHCNHENPFCAMMAENNACAACIHFQKKLTGNMGDQPRTMTCPSGLTETAVPVRLGNQLIGILQMGQVFRNKPSQRQFQKVAAQAVRNGLKPKLEKLRQAYFATRVVNAKQYASMVQLLKIFAQQLATLANQVVVRVENSEPPMIRRAKEFILRHQADDLSLDMVAKEIHTSSFYFCKMFKRSTGLTFTSYLSRMRIEKAKNLLLNPNLRISEIAFAVGFQSLTHFNRVFQKLAGQSPTEYRTCLPSIRLQSGSKSSLRMA